MINLKPGAARWSTSTPRTWQTAALPIALTALTTGARGVVRAVMGAGKSILQAELIAQLDLPDNVIVVVSVPTISLVMQLAKTIEARLGCEVRRYCTGHTGTKPAGKVNVACHPSLAAFAKSVPRGASVIWIADEAHKTESVQVLTAIEGINPIARIGFTATPWRAKEDESLSSFDELIFNYGPADGIADGVVVPVQMADLSAWAGLPVDELAVAVAVEESAGGIINADGIADAMSFARRLEAAGVSCGVIHSGLPKGEVASIIARSKSGEIKVMVHVNMLAEGVDMPWLRWMIARRKVKSSVRFPQEVGRILRAYPGKESARLYDPHDLWGILSLTLDAVLGGASLLEKNDPEPSDAEPEDKTPKACDILRVRTRSPMAVTVSEVRRHFGMHHNLIFSHRKSSFDITTGEACGSHYDAPASEPQLRYLRDLLATEGARIPERLRPPLREFYKTGEGVDKGYARDLIIALKYLKDNPRVIWR